jgi:hypothetical protein
MKNIACPPSLLPTMTLKKRPLLRKMKIKIESRRRDTFAVAC